MHLSSVVKILQLWYLIIVGPKFNKDDFIFERTHAPGHDGEEIPITIVRKKDTKLDRKYYISKLLKANFCRNKLLLFGYGAYGQAFDVSFNIVNLTALENGWIIAFAHVRLAFLLEFWYILVYRGGNEKGREWHNKGKGDQKINSSKDFISCAEFLIAEKYTHPSLLCAFGSSAGGLLVGKIKFLLK